MTGRATNNFPVVAADIASEWRRYCNEQEGDKDKLYWAGLQDCRRLASDLQAVAQATEENCLDGHKA